ncbi:hypothetical protein BGP77_17130 [Saccharospirillum sp. MSK14-1]|uniref:pilus assembly protein PilP n=1 Tax=Saccharospirillum sp. MSK14-1 TaxID=1897632 RepID=UPI000D33C21E|nr:pilus assembly protein PilP [Saccharospirillum sp. MSK14-1]PTY38169.1 hypothetical protein BGP77_17130 [Saccharospirillum sp. MSK14-1]
MRPLLTALLLTTLLSGCERQTAMSDLHALVADTEVAALAKASSDSLAMDRKVRYTAQDQRSPFQYAVSPTASKERASTASLNPVDRKAPAKLSAVSLDDLTMVGTLSGINSASAQALFRDRSGQIHRLSVGDLVGAHAARIVSVSEERVELLEKVPLEEGGWILEPRTFLLTQQKPSRL